MRRILEIDGAETPVWLASTGHGHVLHVGDRELPCTLAPSVGKGAYTLELGGKRVALRIAVGESATFVHLNGRAYEVGRTDPSESLGEAGSGAAHDHLVAPMPGVVISVAVAPGDKVSEGQAMMVIESMKLETTMAAPRDGIVAEVPFATGDAFGVKDVLLWMELEEETS